MAKLPEYLERETHVDLQRRNLEPRIRLAVLAVFAAISSLGLANFFGQRVGERTVRGDRADVTLEAPSAARGGLIYQVRIRVDAHDDLEKPMLVFDPGWYDGLTINTFEPDPVDWEHRDGRNVMIYGPVPAGEKLVVRLQYQVNPTVVGHRTQNMTLEDGGEPVVFVEHDLNVFP